MGEANGVEAALNAAEKANLQELLSQGRAAMTARDMEKADRFTLAAVNMARGDDRALAGRVRTLFKWVDLFWQIVGAEIRHFETGRELHLGGTIVAVVETQGEEFTIHAEGRNRRFTLRQLPPKVAEAIALSRLPESGDDRELCLGAFWAMDRWGDRELARRHWEQAGEAGRALMPELQFAPPVESGRPDDWGVVADSRPPEKAKARAAPLATPAGRRTRRARGAAARARRRGRGQGRKDRRANFWGLASALNAKERTELAAKLCHTAQSESDRGGAFCPVSRGRRARPSRSATPRKSASVSTPSTSTSWSMRC